jgi:hypothetical protein
MMALPAPDAVVIGARIKLTIGESVNIRRIIEVVADFNWLKVPSEL